MKISKYKNEFDYSYTLGLTLTIELLKRKPRECLQIYFHPSYIESDSSKIINTLINKYNIPFETNLKIFNILSQKENCFVIGIFNKYFSEIDSSNHIVLVNPANSGNLGTIIRSALGFGIKNIAIIKPGVDIFDPKTIRSSMGALFNISFEYFSSFEDYYNKFSNNNIYPFMLQAKNNLSNQKFIEPYSLVFGNEATGLDNKYLKYQSVIIPHSKDIDSLNLPIAVSIACYEATKNKWNK